MMTLVLFAIQLILLAAPKGWLWFDPASAPLWKLPILTISYMFGHASWPHFLYNWLFAAPAYLYVEYRLGSKNLLLAYLCSGLCALLAHEAYVRGMGAVIGSSGSAFGLCTVAAILALRLRWGRYVLWSLLGGLLIGQVMALPFSFVTGVAVMGHLGGAFGGLVYWALLTANYRPDPPESRAQKRSRSRRKGGPK